MCGCVDDGGKPPHAFRDPMATTTGDGVDRLWKEILNHTSSQQVSDRNPSKAAVAAILAKGEATRATRELHRTPTDCSAGCRLYLVLRICDMHFF